jgi:D-alanine-D-alanine ligase-like ATP-grasp enzyme
MKGIAAVSSRRRNMLAFRLDLLRALGVRHSARRLLANTRHRRALGARGERVTDQMWREAARELGAEVRELAPSLLEFRLGRATARVRGQITPLVDPVSDALASDKVLAYRVLAEAGVRVPEHTLVRVVDIAAAARFLERIPGAVIVKPARGAGGAGVTGEVRTTAQLRRALVAAGRYHAEALLQQQLGGDTYRLLVLEGEVLDIIKRPRPTVVGDGRSTIEQLMFRQYAERIADGGPSGLKPFSVDLDCLFTLESAGYGISSVLPAGAAITVKTATNYNGPHQTETVRPPYPDAFVAPARGAAAAVGVRLAGVDLLAGGHGAPAILEVNPTPGLTHHYNVADAAQAGRIAVPILAKLLQEGAAEPARGR